jgi:hypothetical protein
LLATPGNKFVVTESIRVINVANKLCQRVRKNGKLKCHVDNINLLKII